LQTGLVKPVQLQTQCDTVIQRGTTGSANAVNVSPAVVSTHCRLSSM